MYVNTATSGMDLNGKRLGDIHNDSAALGGRLRNHDKLGVHVRRDVHRLVARRNIGKASRGKREHEDGGGQHLDSRQLYCLGPTKWVDWRCLQGCVLEKVRPASLTRWCQAEGSRFTYEPISWLLAELKGANIKSM